jgi:hypothetical protein
MTKVYPPAASRIPGCSACGVRIAARDDQRGAGRARAIVVACLSREHGPCRGCRVARGDARRSTALAAASRSGPAVVTRRRRCSPACSLAHSSAAPAGGIDGTRPTDPAPLGRISAHPQGDEARDVVEPRTGTGDPSTPRCDSQHREKGARRELEFALQPLWLGLSARPPASCGTTPVRRAQPGGGGGTGGVRPARSRHDRIPAGGRLPPIAGTPGRSARIRRVEFRRLPASRGARPAPPSARPTAR